MPLYDYYCEGCGWTGEALRTYADRDGDMPCTCGRYAGRMPSLTAPITPDINPYYDRGLGAHVEGRAHKRRLMAERSVVPVESTRMHGARGTVFSWPGGPATSVPPSGAYDTTPARA